MSEPNQVDNSNIQNTILYKTFISNDNTFLNVIEGMKTKEMQFIIDKMSIIIVGAMLGKFNIKALKILTDSEFIIDLVSGKINTERLTNLIKFELDNRVNSSFDVRNKYNYVSIDELRFLLTECQKNTSNLLDENIRLKEKIDSNEEIIEYLRSKIENSATDNMSQSDKNNTKITSLEFELKASEEKYDELKNYFVKKVDELYEKDEEIAKLKLDLQNKNISETNDQKDNNTKIQLDPENKTIQIQGLFNSKHNTIKQPVIENKSDIINLSQKPPVFPKNTLLFPKIPDSFISTTSSESSPFRNLSEFDSSPSIKDNSVFLNSKDVSLISPFMLPPNVSTIDENINSDYIVSNTNDNRIRYQPVIKSDVNPRLIGIINSISGK